MTKLLIVSDTHGNVGKLDDLIRKYDKQYDYLIHLGDRSYDILSLQESIGNLIAVKGNIEGQGGLSREGTPYEVTVEIDGVRIFATHGHRYSVKSTLIFLKKQAKKVGANLVLFGHTHEKYLEIEDDIMYFNPGALTDNDYGFIAVDKGEIVSIEHVYLSERG